MHKTANATGTRYYGSKETKLERGTGEEEEDGLTWSLIVRRLSYNTRTHTHI